MQHKFRACDVPVAIPRVFIGSKPWLSDGGRKSQVFKRPSCICAWCHVSRLTKYEGTQGTHDCTKDDLCTSDFRFVWACLVYSGLKCGQTAARGISLSVYVRSVVACIGSPGPCLPAAPASAAPASPMADGPPVHLCPVVSGSLY